MKNVGLMFAMILAVVVLALPAHAQEMAKKDAATKPALSPSQAVLDSWNDIARKLIAMAEDFPEDKYDFKPTPAQRTFAEQLLHAAGANYFFTNLTLGEKPPAEEGPQARPVQNQGRRRCLREKVVCRRCRRHQSQRR